MRARPTGSCDVVPPPSVTLSLSLPPSSNLSHSLRSHSLAPSGTAPDRKWAGREAGPREGGASWLHNLLGERGGKSADSGVFAGNVAERIQLTTRLCRLLLLLLVVVVVVVLLWVKNCDSRM